MVRSEVVRPPLRHRLAEESSCLEIPLLGIHNRQELRREVTDEFDLPQALRYTLDDHAHLDELFPGRQAELLAELVRHQTVLRVERNQNSAELFQILQAYAARQGERAIRIFRLIQPKTIADRTDLLAPVVLALLIVLLLQAHDIENRRRNEKNQTGPEDLGEQPRPAHLRNGRNGSRHDRT